MIKLIIILYIIYISLHMVSMKILFATYNVPYTHPTDHSKDQIARTDFEAC